VSQDWANMHTTTITTWESTHRFFPSGLSRYDYTGDTEMAMGNPSPSASFRMAAGLGSSRLLPHLLLAVIAH
jgi:hypothetical protein